MKLIVGLGNPGKKYETTRHNVGFLCLDTLGERLGLTFTKESRFQALVAVKVIGNEKCYFLKPETFMNLSGEAVGSMMRYYKIALEDVLIVYDDMDLPFGTLRLREKGSAGGHNGIKSIIAHVGSEEFKRIRVGIAAHQDTDAKDYVLGNFSASDYKRLAVSRNYVADAVMAFIDGQSFSVVMGSYNGKTCEEVDNK